MIEFDNLSEQEQTKYLDKATELLLGLHYCSRVWEAWSVGTMTQYDFGNADEDDDIVWETAETLYNFVQQEKG